MVVSIIHQVAHCPKKPSPQEISIIYIILWMLYYELIYLSRLKFFKSVATKIFINYY